MNPLHVKQQARTIDDLFAELLSVIAPYGLALVSVVMIAASASEQYHQLSNWHPVWLGVASFFLVISGLAIYSTAFEIVFRDEINNTIKATAVLCALTYTVTFAVMVLILKLNIVGAPDWVIQLQSMAPYACIVLLDAASIVNLTIRRKTYKLNGSFGSKKRKKRPNAHPVEQTDDERTANREKANQARKVPDDRKMEVAKLRSEGVTRAQLAEQYGVKPGTITRWTAQGNELITQRNGHPK